MSKIDIEINSTQQQNINKNLTFYLSYVDKDGKPLVRDTPDGL